jgi:hypothetical protein
MYAHSHRFNYRSRQDSIPLAESSETKNTEKRFEQTCSDREANSMARVVLARQEFLEKEASQAPRIVANNTVFFEQVVEHDAIAEFL